MKKIFFILLVTIFLGGVYLFIKRPILQPASIKDSIVKSEITCPTTEPCPTIESCPLCKVPECNHQITIKEVEKLVEKIVYKDTPQTLQLVNQQTATIANLQKEIADYKNALTLTKDYINTSSDNCQKYMSDITESCKKIVTDQTQEYEKITNAIYNKCEQALSSCSDTITTIKSSCQSSYIPTYSIPYIPAPQYNSPTNCRISQNYSGGSWTMNCY